MVSFKRIILFLHRWLGLISGLVVFIVCITGCLFAFQQEFTQWSRYDMMHADTKGEETLPVSVLQQKAADALGIDHLNYGLTTYKNTDRNWSAYAYRAAPGHWTYFGSMKEYKTVYINPYTGKIAGIVNEKHDFFQIVKGIHWSLLLATPIGQPIVVWSTIIFLVILILGLILWWPKKWDRTGRQRSFKIKRGSSWRRMNYDLHNVAGFYFLIIAVILGLTGLFWYFPNLSQKFSLLGSDDLSGTPNSTEKAVYSTPTKNPLQIAYHKAWTKFPEANSIIFITPVNPKGRIQAIVSRHRNTYYARSVLEFNQHSGQLIHSNLYRKKTISAKLVAMNYDIHVGAIAGLPGKIIAFLASLVAASLPVTGFIIWWDREKRKWEKV